MCPGCREGDPRAVVDKWCDKCWSEMLKAMSHEAAAASYQNAKQRRRWYDKSPARKEARRQMKREARWAFLARNADEWLGMIQRHDELVRRSNEDFVRKITEKPKET